MAHEKVYGFCENKCKVEVAPKTETDAVEERVTALEAGEFETIKGNRVGVVTATGHPWSEVVGIASASYSIGMGTSSGSKDVTLPVTGLVGYDTFVNMNCTYTVSLNTTYYKNDMTTTGTLTVTDIISGQTYTVSLSATNNQTKTQTLVAPVLCNMNFQLKNSWTASWDYTMKLSVTRDKNYFVVGK